MPARAGDAQASDAQVHVPLMPAQAGIQGQIRRSKHVALLSPLEFIPDLIGDGDERD
jgi:hypothetical protein